MNEAKCSVLEMNPCSTNVVMMFEKNICTTLSTSSAAREINSTHQNPHNVPTGCWGKSGGMFSFE